MKITANNLEQNKREKQLALSHMRRLIRYGENYTNALKDTIRRFRVTEKYIRELIKEKSK